MTKVMTVELALPEDRASKHVAGDLDNNGLIN